MGTNKKANNGVFDVLFNKSVPHIFEKIFLNLDYDSFLSCREVSKVWRELLSSEMKKVEHILLEKKRANELWLCHNSRDGNIVEVNYLLDNGADPNCDNAYSTPLIAAATNGHIKVVNILLNAGANCEKTVYNGITALHCASECGQKKVVQVLLKTGAKVKIEDNVGNTPLHLAARYDHPEIVKLLIDGGADIKWKQLWKVVFIFRGLFYIYWPIILLYVGMLSLLGVCSAGVVYIILH